MSAEGLPSASFICLGGLAKIEKKKQNGTRRVMKLYAWWERGGKFGYQLQRSQDFDLEVQKTCMSGRIPHLSHSHGKRGKKG